MVKLLSLLITLISYSIHYSVEKTLNPRGILVVLRVLSRVDVYTAKGCLQC